MVGGGSGSYTYSWTSIPGGFGSTQANPVVSPGESTNYILSISDGFNQATGMVNVHVKPVPLFPGWPADTTACIFETVRLDAGNPGSSYYWSNGAITQFIDVETAGIGYDVQNYRVKVLNGYGCTDSVDSRVSFSFSACTAITEVLPSGSLMVYPNPGGGKLHVEASYAGAVELTVTNIVGELVVLESLTFKGGESISRDYDLSFLPKGLYLVKIRSGEFTRVVKFVNR
jgi:hypothetical protein